MLSSVRKPTMLDAPTGVALRIPPRRVDGASPAPAVRMAGRRVRRDWTATFVVGVLYFLVAAASYNGFFTKWQLRDSTPEFSLAAMLDGTAQRPWVYRQLLPVVANAVERALPPSVHDAALRFLFKPNGSPITKVDTPLARDPRYTLRYHGIFYLTFLLFVAALFVLRTMCIEVTGDVVAGTLAPLAFALLVPVLMTIGGYFYDFVELLFMAGAVYAVVNGRWIMLLLITPLAVANKEAFVFFAIALYPLVRVHLDRTRAVLLTIAVVLLAGASHLPIRATYAGNPGTAAVYQLWTNMAFYVNPFNLFRLESTYNIVMFKGYNPIVLLLLAIVIRSGWSSVAPPWRRHLLLAFAVNFPLLILYCAPGEMRNLSLCYVGFTVVMAAAISRWTAEPTRHISEPTRRTSLI